MLQSALQSTGQPLRQRILPQDVRCASSRKHALDSNSAGQSESVSCSVMFDSV